MKKLLSIFASVSLIVLPAVATNINIDKGISIISVTPQDNGKLVTVKAYDDDNTMSESYKQTVSHELSYYGIKCNSKEIIYYGYKLYNPENVLIKEFNLPPAFNSWIKIDDNDQSLKYGHIIYNKVCQ